MEKAVAIARDSSDGASAATWRARAEAASGRFRSAHDLYLRAVEEARTDSYHELAAQWTAEDAEGMALTGQCQEAQPQGRRALEASRDNFTLERVSRVFALCGAARDATDLTRELTNRFPQATLTTKLQVPVTSAVIALRASDPERALRLLQEVSQYDQAPAAEFWPQYLRAQAEMMLGRPREANAQFTAITDHRGEAPTSPLYSLALRGSAQAAASAGDTDAARRHYERFFDAWGQADEGLAVVRDARQEYARIR
jgi:tetratricopeptide (TPR) repeat protein